MIPPYRTMRHEEKDSTAPLLQRVARRLRRGGMLAVGLALVSLVVYVFELSELTFFQTAWEAGAGLGMGMLALSLVALGLDWTLRKLGLAVRRVGTAGQEAYRGLLRSINRRPDPELLADEQALEPGDHELNWNIPGLRDERSFSDWLEEFNGTLSAVRQWLRGERAREAARYRVSLRLPDGDEENEGEATPAGLDRTLPRRFTRGDLERANPLLQDLVKHGSELVPPAENPDQLPRPGYQARRSMLRLLGP